MRILFTGASSFTGFWFVRELARAGHDVVAVLRSPVEQYPDEPRRSRVRELTPCCQTVIGPAFGDDSFLQLAASGPWDVLCHHAADVTNYKSPDFDVMAATQNNTRNASTVLERMKASGCRRIVVTGSVFECDEGAGSGDLPAFSPYGLSKALSWQAFRYYAGRSGLSLGKFVIPNPFGAWEEPRFTAYLMKNWLAGKSAGVNTPDYVRDNIHVSLLARTYARFVESMSSEPGVKRLRPSGYVESQGAFALRFAAEMRKRLKLPCDVTLGKQTDFSEPLMRVNTEPARPLDPDWSEDAAWDDIAAYYTRATDQRVLN
jgi:UDP-glucose 4-epimerase